MMLLLVEELLVGLIPKGAGSSWLHAALGIRNIKMKTAG